MKTIREVLNDPKCQGLIKNPLKIYESVCNPSDSIQKSLVHLQQPSLIFGNLWRSLPQIFGNLW